VSGAAFYLLDGWLERAKQLTELRETQLRQDNEAKLLAQEQKALSPKLQVRIYPDIIKAVNPLQRYHVDIQNLNRQSAPILDLHIEFHFKNTIARIYHNVISDSPGMNVGGVEIQSTKRDGSTVEYVETPTELAKTFSFQIRKASLNAKEINLDLVELFVDEWSERGFFTGYIIVDASKRPPVLTKPAEAGTFRGHYSYEVRGQRFSEDLIGSIPDWTDPTL
jgi:hypothetical protein